MSHPFLQLLIRHLKMLECPFRQLLLIRHPDVIRGEKEWYRTQRLPSLSSHHHLAHPHVPVKWCHLLIRRSPSLLESWVDGFNSLAVGDRVRSCFVSFLKCVWIVWTGAYAAYGGSRGNGWISWSREISGNYFLPAPLTNMKLVPGYQVLPPVIVRLRKIYTYVYTLDNTFYVYQLHFCTTLFLFTSSSFSSFYQTQQWFFSLLGLPLWPLGKCHCLQ